MKKITIVFSSGAIQEFVVESLSLTRNGFGQLIEVEWKGAKGQKTPMRINLDNVDGIFSEDMPAEDAMSAIRQMMI
ncbi:hypothetical protein [Brevibacillus massiliensis]|uniref:hypothetical protein n=1 Tax=Brevibacillus massiliensis TaxID=1118054 RepID=UPI0003008C1C|nr:hypothetical protein [Brevibacillus massiliensis]